MEVRVLSAALFSTKRTTGDAYSLRFPLFFGSGLDALDSTVFEEVVSEGLDSDAPSDRPSGLPDLPSEGLGDGISDDVGSDLLSDLDSDELFESDAADFLYDSLR